jgi:hypothetical protein
MTAPKIGSLTLAGFLALYLPGVSQARSDLTPEEIAAWLYEGCPIVKAKCTAISQEATPRGPVWGGKFVIPDEIESPPKPSFVLKDGRLEEVWLRAEKPVAKAGDQVDAAWQRSEKPAEIPGDDVVLIYYPKWDEWFAPGVTVSQYDVISNAPAGSDGGKKRLLYWFPYRDSEDAILKAMTRMSFEYCSNEGFFAAAKKIPVERLREGFDRATTNERGGYGIMLGVAGDDSDAMRFEEAIKRSLAGDEQHPQRPELVRLLLGYLQLNPTEAVKLCEGELLNDGTSWNVRYAAMVALATALKLQESALPRDLGLRALHRILDQPDINDLAITELIRLGDWTQSSKLDELWDQKAENAKQIRRVIIGYLLLAERNGTAAESNQAREVLASLRARDLAGAEKAETQARQMMPELSRD